MEIIPLMLISVIILLTSFPAPIKVSGRGGGGGFVGSGNSPSIGSGYFGGGGNPGTGYMGGGIPSGGSIRDGSNVGTGYRGGFQGGKPSGGGDPGAAIVVFPKKPEEPVKVVPTPMPQVCEPKVRHCINVHVYGRAGQPHRGGACCNKFRYARRCVCKFLVSNDTHLNKQSNGVLRGCHFKRNCVFRN
ncbi:unnamed protein product [Arabidopsis thaliana]|uniref:Uncharacterized protein n=3 Tax=Arabidopsis TaxID=3701 RepID=A0A654ER85_ARATH|nr:uncharacterized protein AT1G76965 [Arabidopsis thaliana]AEE35913.1 hypothetical protein AT1G76965 [Arabidopsis thaliana]CAA0338752.1 unnamed protein product [Arabidopsis thaliana]VYS51270.1 unnamed protein product [Arabidopsis thaliana]|eukprot:NP_001319393.1 hypothetical protein AT1G76965 [Arabidopsis thaliana]